MHRPFRRLLDRTRRVTAPDDESDADLLTRFAAERDEWAFAVLLRRHGPMVFGVCRRLTRTVQDAEDAFQASFLVLACKPEAVRPPGRLGAWLHGVAVRCAKKAAARTDRFRASTAVPDLPDQTPPPLDSDIRRALDDAIAGLPAAYRAAVVLCHLEGRTRTEAARLLGWTEGTLSGRLARALALLGRRLTARGVTCPAVVAAVGVPNDLLASTEAAAGLVAAGAPAGGTAAALTIGVLRIMMLKRIPVLTTQLLIAIGVGLLGLSAVPIPARDKTPNPAVRKAGWQKQFVLTHEYSVARVAVCAEWVATADDRGSIYFWKAASGERDRKIVNGLLEVGDDQPFETIDRLAFTLDGSELYWVFNGGAGYGYINSNTAHGQKVRYGPAAASRRIDYSPDGNWCLDQHVEHPKVLIVSRNNWKFKNNTSYRDGFAYSSEVRLAAGSADNNLLAVWTAADELVIRDVESKKNRHVIPLKGRTVTTARFSPDGGRLAVIGADRLLTVFDTATGKPVPGFIGHAGDALDVAFSPDGTRLLTGGDDRTARIWEAATGKPLAVLKGHADSVVGVAYGPDGKTLATASADKTVKVWAWAE